MGAVTDVQTYLEAESLIGGGTGWPSSQRLMHDDSDRLVVISEDGGSSPELGAAEGVGEVPEADVGVHFMVRAAPMDSEASFGQALAILSALHGLKHASIGGQTYIRARAVTGEPIFVGYDDRRRPIHTVAFRLKRDA